MKKGGAGDEEAAENIFGKKITMAKNEHIFWTRSPLVLLEKTR